MPNGGVMRQPFFIKLCAERRYDTVIYLREKLGLVRRWIMAQKKGKKGEIIKKNSISAAYVAEKLVHR